LSDVRVACAERGCTAILVEEDLAGPGLPMLDLYQIVEAGGESSRSLLRIAYVDVQQQARAGNARFVETVARNRGFNLRTFATTTEAEAWLREAPIGPAD
jgi:hypothetical protein